jgi:hypothetical protein
VYLGWSVEPVILRFPLLFRVNEFQLKAPEQLWYYFVHLAERDLFVVRARAIGALQANLRSCQCKSLRHHRTANMSALFSTSTWGNHTWNIHLSILAVSGLNHLSGTKASASFPKMDVSRCVTAALTPALVPLGNHSPAIIAPDADT